MNEKQWIDGRYTLMFDEHTFFVWDNENDERMTALEVTKKLNEQQATIQSLKEENRQLREINKEIGDDLHNCRLKNEELMKNDN